MERTDDFATGFIEALCCMVIIAHLSAWLT